MADSPINTPEQNLASELITFADSEADVKNVLEHISETDRNKVYRILVGLIEQITRPGKKSLLEESAEEEIRTLAESLKLEQGFSDAIETQRAFQLTKPGESMPDFGQVLSTFNPEMLKAAQSFQSPTLILRPKNRSFNDLIEALSEPDRGGVDYHRSYVGKMLNRHANIRSKGWGAYLVEGATKVETQEFDDTNLTLEERLKKFDAYKRANGINGMNRWNCVMLMMQNLTNWQPTYSKLWTILDEDPVISKTIVTSGQWKADPKNANGDFSFFHTNRKNDTGRFRRSVGGDVLSF
jgi:hypothetical protein